MDRKTIDLWCERGILGLVLGMLWFAVLATGAVRMLEMLVVQGFAIGILILWIVRFWVRTEHRLLWPPTCWFVLLFLGFAFYNLPKASVFYPARDEIIKIVLYAFVFFAVLDNLNRQETSQIVVFGLVALGCVISIYALYQFLTGSERVWHFVRPPGYKGRGSGTFICPNHLAGFLEMVLPLGIAFTVASRLKALGKVFIGYGTAMIAAGLAVSISRAGWASTAIALGLFFLILLRSRDYRIPAIIMLIFIAGGVFFFAKNAFSPKKRLERLFQGPNLDDTRTALRGATVEIWRDHFWTGAGPAQFDEQFRRYRPPNFQLRPLFAHNDYINTLADYGIVGAVIIAGAFISLFWGVVKAWKYIWRTTDLGTKPSNRSALVLGGSLGLVAILAHSAFDFNMHIPSNALVMVVIMALVLGHFRYATERYWVRFGWIGKSVASLATTAGLFFLITETAQTAREYAVLSKADKPGLDSKKAMELLKAAWEVEPRNGDSATRVGELLRLQSWEGRDGYQDQAREAIVWFDRGIAANPLNPDNYMLKGMCLDWLKDYKKGYLAFQQAVQHDPNSYWVVMHMGWHFFQAGDYDRAKLWFDRSLQIKNDEVARFYLEQIKQRQAERLEKVASEAQSFAKEPVG